jgi:NAD(P)-dependent dehydrogenase (short-subunit alcohol dehydrogenase family)
MAQNIKAAARRLARDGAKLALEARRLNRLRALAKDLSLGDYAVMETDVTQYEQVKRLVDRAALTYGRILERANSGHSRCRGTWVKSTRADICDGPAGAHQTQSRALEAGSACSAAARPSAVWRAARGTYQNVQAVSILIIA